MSDDQGYGDASSYNPESKIPTPGIDRIAREGIHFTDAHSSSAVCTPTRYGLLTGRYNWRSRLTLHLLENGAAGVSLGKLVQVLAVIGMENDLSQIATDDILGRKLEDARLTETRKRAPKKKPKS